MYADCITDINENGWKRVKTCKWVKTGKTGENWCKEGKVGDNVWKQAKMGQN